MTFLRTALPLVAALAIPALAHAQEAPRPELLNRLTDCRGMADPAARLSCYDMAVEALDAAERQGEVVVVDRAQVRESRRALFGFDMPSLPAFGRVTAGEDEVSSVETTLTRASRGGDGKWVFRLSDGSTWRQIEFGIGVLSQPRGDRGAGSPRLHGQLHDDPGKQPRRARAPGPVTFRLLSPGVRVWGQIHEDDIAPGEGPGRHPDRQQPARRRRTGPARLRPGRGLGAGGRTGLRLGPRPGPSDPRGGGGPGGPAGDGGVGLDLLSIRHAFGRRLGHGPDGFGRHEPGRGAGGGGPGRIRSVGPAALADHGHAGGVGGRRFRRAGCGDQLRRHETQDGGGQGLEPI